VIRGALHDAVAGADRHGAVIEFERDLTVEDQHGVARVRAVEARIGGSVERMRGQLSGALRAQELGDDGVVG
jgi:hypothetical protein